MADAAGAVRAGGAVETVRVALGARAYDIRIGDGLIAGAGPAIAACLPGARVAIVTDTNVAGLHLSALETSLAQAGVASVPVVVPAGEASKSYARFAEVCDAVIAARLERRDAIVALGGGVIGDLAGYVAASVRRGMDFVQIPTSLLAQVDSSVGGKTGINSPHGKNLVGAFHQPRLVLADTAALRTLPAREFRAGYAEVVKYGLIDKPDFFDWLEANREAVFAGGPARTRAIAESCRAKADVVARDEHETGDRALLNLGHTFGHAIEAAAGYDGEAVVHGEAVAIGMSVAHHFSAELGLCPPADAERVDAHLRAAGLPLRIADLGGHNRPAGEALRALTPQRMMDLMAQDKKVVRGAFNLILSRGIGRAFIAKGVDQAAIQAFLARRPA